MKLVIRIIVPCCLLLLSFTTDTSFSGFKPVGVVDHIKKETNVWICNSEKSVAYHSKKDCRGLNNCKHEIKEVTKTDAMNVYGRRACKICY